MRRIIEKLEKRGYSADKELALSIYGKLDDALKHRENLLVAVAGIWIGLLTILGIDVVTTFGFFWVWLWLMVSALRTRNLLRRLTVLIVRDPPMSVDDLDFWMIVVGMGIIWLGGFLKLFFGF